MSCSPWTTASPAVRAGSEHAVDAFVVAVADLADGVVVATVDADDFAMVARHGSNVVIADIRPGWPRQFMGSGPTRPTLKEWKP